MPYLSRRMFTAGISASALSPFFSARAESATTIIPLELTANRVIISAVIDNNGPFRLVLDTGGIVSLLKLDLARRLRLRELGRQTLGMAGAQGSYPIFLAREVVFGSAARETNLIFAGTDVISFGDDLDGSVGAGLVTGIDAELDFDRGELRIPPNRDFAGEGWVRGERAIEHKGLPNGSAFLFASVTLGGQRLRCGLDTGFPQPLRLTADAARKCGLLDRNWSPGPKGIRWVRVDALTLGGTELQHLVIAFQFEDRGPSDYGDGIVGLPLLRQFNLATDVKSALLWTRRNSQPRSEPRYNMFGLWLDRASGGATVGQVGRGSPAERAGIMVGDQVSGDFAALIRQLASLASDSIELKIVRGDQQRPIALTPADFL